MVCENCIGWAFGLVLVCFVSVVFAIWDYCEYRKIKSQLEEYKTKDLIKTIMNVRGVSNVE